MPMADIIFFAVFIFFAFFGYKRGVLRTLYSIFRLYFSFIIAIFFYGRLALLLQAMLDMSSAAARIVCFTTLFAILLAALWTTEIFLKKRIAKALANDSSLSKIGGCILGLLEGALILSILIMDINFYPVPDGAKSPLEGAVSYKVVKQIAPSIEYFTLSPISRLKDMSSVIEPDKSESDSQPDSP